MDGFEALLEKSRTGVERWVGHIDGMFINP